MTVYVDDMRMQATVPNGSRRVSGRWSHLMADSEEELIAFAVGTLGMRPSWIQHPGTPDAHFDVTEPKRQAALAAGAVNLPCRSAAWIEFFERSRARWCRRCANCGTALRFLGASRGSEHYDDQVRCADPVPGFDGTKRAWMLRPDREETR